jgi:hypothetical protein
VVLAPEIAVSRWFNTSEPLTLSGLRGRPALLHAFQVHHGFGQQGDMALGAIIAAQLAVTRG